MADGIAAFAELVWFQIIEVEAERSRNVAIKSRIHCREIYQQHQQQKDVSRRKNPRYSPLVKQPQWHCLQEQDACHQKAGQHEKQIDADSAEIDPRHMQKMPNQQGQNGKAPPAVEVGDTRCFVGVR